MVRNLYINKIKSGFTGWMTFCILTVILLLNISEIAYTQNIDESQLEAIRQQLRQSGMTESEIESKINLLKVSGGVPRRSTGQVIPDLEEALIAQDSLGLDITSDIVSDESDKKEKIFDEFLELDSLRQIELKESLAEIDSV